jgi:uncharacterized protein YndB with AHSA1/START domain
MNAQATTLDRSYDAAPAVIWELWTTPAGIEGWWSPDGFTTEVRALDLRPGGELVYLMTATAPEQVAFMESAGLPLSTESRKTFTELDAPNRIAYESLIDFVPGMAPYRHLTTVEITPEGDGSRVVMTMEPLHDDEWTQRLVAGRANELDNLATLIARRMTER